MSRVAFRVVSWPHKTVRRLVMSGWLVNSPAPHGQELVVLDVRRHDEWRDGHIDEVPRGMPVRVHCMSGFRASIAASLLDRAGREVVAIHDDWAQAADHDLPLRKAG